MIFLLLIIMILFIFLIFLYYKSENIEKRQETEQPKNLVYLHSYFSNESKLYLTMIRNRSTKDELEDILLAMEDNDNNLVKSFGNSLTKSLTVFLRQKRKILTSYIKLLIKFSRDNKEEYISDSDEEDQNFKAIDEGDVTLTKLRKINRELATNLLGEKINILEYNKLHKSLHDYDEKLVKLAKSSLFRKKRIVRSIRDDRHIEESIQEILLSLS